MGIKFKEALDNKLISPDIIKILPSKCKCNNELMFTDSIRELQCSNKNCYTNISNRILKFCNDTNIDLNISKIYNLVIKLKLISPYQILLLEDAYNSKLITKEDVENIDDILQQIRNIKSKQYNLYEIAKLCEIDNINKVAYKLFNGFASFEEAFEEIDTGQVSFINERLGTKSSDSSVLAVEIYNNILELKEELLFGETQLSVKDNTKKIIRIAFSDNVLPFINKGELIDYLNNTYNYKFIIVTTISDTTDILIKNSDGNTNKYRAAKLINERFIADSMNKGEITLKDIGVFKEKELKPIGSRIYIETLDNILKRLNILRDN